MHELRYFQEIIALSDDVQILWLEKCECIAQKKFRWHEALKIYFDGKEEWIFDYLPTFREASEIISEASLPRFEASLLRFKCKYRGRK